MVQNKVKEIEGQFYLKNNKAYPAEDFKIDDSIDGPRVYEVIRVLEGIPLFLEEHLVRLQESIALLGYSIVVNSKQLEEEIETLIRVNGLTNMNIKLIVSGLNSSEPDFYLFFIPSYYPSDAQYHEGVSVILYNAIRKNPNVKAVAATQREEINRAIAAARVYEALLVNEREEITEGSRSNLFFIHSDSLYTPPIKDVLGGITRGRIMKLCIDLGIKVVEAPITLSFLKEAEGLFLTGTSPKILPIAILDKQAFSSANHPLLHSIKDGYDQLIRQYIIEKGGRI